MKEAKWLLLLVLVTFSALSAPARPQAGDPSIVGQWGPVLGTSSVARHAVLLPNGKVLYWPTGSGIYLWDIAANTHTKLDYGRNIFCSGHSFLEDGRLLITGGHDRTNGKGLADAVIFNYRNNSFTRTADMNDRRWYPTNATLADGHVLVASGSVDPSYTNNPLQQIWNPATGTWRDLTGAVRSMPLYPFLFLAPNGKVFNPGPNTDTRYLDTAGTGSWSFVANRSIYRDYGSAVMYDDGKVILIGGQDPPLAHCEVIDLNLPSPTWRTVSSMSIARRQINATIMADGKVLVTGGGSTPGFDEPSGAVFHAEAWDPAAEAWTNMASYQRFRLYHSVALLLPDGRIWSAGDDDQSNYEVFSPPYLFKGARPVIDTAPSGVSFGQSFFVGTPDGAAVENVHLIRLGSVTHAFNQEQRILKPTFSRVTGGLSVAAPTDPAKCPPGPYMLFLLNGNGVPSVARILRVGTTSDPIPPAPLAPSNLTATAVSGSQINVSWTDNANNEDGFLLERSTDGTTFVRLASLGANVTSYSNGGLTAGTTYHYRVRAQNAGGYSVYSNTASATPQAATTPPAAPTGLTAASVSQTQINLSWTDNSANEDGFIVEISLDGVSWTEKGRVGPNVTTFASGGLNKRTFYHHRVRSFNAAGVSAPTNTTKTRTFA